jgi:hypothetical protein
MWWRGRLGFRFMYNASGFISDWVHSFWRSKVGLTQGERVVSDG